MNKSTFFSGQPIFAQLFKLIPKDSLSRIVRISKSVNPRLVPSCFFDFKYLLVRDWLPPMRKQFADLVDGMFINSSDHILEPIVGVDVIADTGTDQAVDHSQAFSATLTAGK